MRKTVNCSSTNKDWSIKTELCIGNQQILSQNIYMYIRKWLCVNVSWNPIKEGFFLKWLSSVSSVVLHAFEVSEKPFMCPYIVNRNMYTCEHEIKRCMYMYIGLNF